MIIRKRPPQHEPKPQDGSEWLRAGAFGVHLLTASGALLALLALAAAARGELTATFWWLGLALLVDGIDGPLARRLNVKEVLPQWSGELLDNIVDYLTYVLVPALVLHLGGMAGEALSLPAAAIMVVSSALYYADTRMKTAENFFLGFPVVWNMVVFTLLAVKPGEHVVFAVVVAAAAFSFMPVHFLHPVRVRRLRPLNLAMFLVWCALGFAALLRDLEPGPVLRTGLAVTAIYLFCIGGVMQIFPDLGRPDLGRKESENDQGHPRP